MNQMSATSPVSLQPYLLQLLGIFLMGSVVATAFFALTGIEAPSAMGIIVLMASLSPVASSFAKNTGRVMTTGERAKFALLGTIATFVLSIAVLLLALLIGGVPISISGLSQAFGVGSDFALFAAIVVGVGLVVGWLVIYFGMGFMGRMMLKQIEAAKNKK
jgi:hypothetical protein